MGCWFLDVDSFTTEQMLMMFEVLFSPEFLDFGRWAWAWSAFLWRNPQRQRFSTRADLRSRWSISPGYIWEGKLYLNRLNTTPVTPQWAIQKYPEIMYSIFTLFISHQYPIHILQQADFFDTSKIGGTLEGWKTLHFYWNWGPSRSMMIYGLRCHESPRTSASASYFAAPAGRLRRQTACKAGWRIPTGLTPWAGTVLSRWGQYPRVRWTSWDIWWFSGIGI